MTRPPDLGGTALSNLTPQAGVSGAKAITGAVARIYAEGGILGFWIGNGLSVTKIFPESAIKFLSYESAVRRHQCPSYDGTLTSFIDAFGRNGCSPSTTIM